MQQTVQQKFGKYTLLRKLASGGMGEIFLAKQEGPSGFEKLLVIKRILSHHLDKKDYLDMFFSEAKLVARLNHPNIIQIHEMGEIDGDYYIAMEYVRGKSLRDLVDELRSEGRVLPLPHVIDLAIKLCEGLGYAHQARDIRGRPMNIVHRDINPHNILISYEGDLKLIDFGIAKSEMTSVNTATGTIKGKFVYMSPEQSAADPIDRRSDIFSLGIVCYETCCLENPFVRQNVVLSLEAIQRQEVPPPSAKRPDAGALDSILARSLHKKPEDRYQTAIEMRDELRDLYRSGEVPPADADLSTFLSSLFAADINEEDRLLAAADAWAKESPGFTGPAPSSMPFSDEEPTMAGEDDEMAQASRQSNFPEEEERTEVPPEHRVEREADPSNTAAGSLYPVADTPTRSDRLPSRSDPDEEVLPAPPMRSNISQTQRMPEAALAEPVGEDTSSRGPIPIPSALPQLDATREMLQNQGSNPSNISGPLPPWSIPAPSQITDEDDGSLQQAQGALRRAGRLFLYAAVLIVTMVMGFVVTWAFMPKDDPVHGASKALKPIDPDNNGVLPDRVPNPGEGRVVDLPSQKSPSEVSRTKLSPPDEVAPSVKMVEPTKVTALVPEPAKTVTTPKKKKRRSKKRRRRTKPRPDKVVVSSPPPPPPPPAVTKKKASTRLGRLTIRTNRVAQVRHGSVSAGASPSSMSVRQTAGKVVLSGVEGVPYQVTLRYEIQSGGLAVKVEASPWAIVKHNGISLGKTPRGPVAAARRHSFQLLRPGQSDPFVVSLTWSPSS